MIVKHGSVFFQKRLDYAENSSFSALYLDGVKVGFIIEDEPRNVKVAKETRIWAGDYELKINKQDTPLTLKYRAKYPWFKYHIEIAGVKGFSGIYIHVGNTEKDTDGCLLLNNKVAIKGNEYVGEESTVLFEQFYKAVYPVLERGDRVYWMIKNEK